MALIDYKDLTVVIETRLPVRTVAQIALEAAREASPDLTVAGVMPGDGGTSYVEILVNVDGWDPDSCQITVGAFRNAGPAAFKRQVVESLQRRLHESHH